MNTLTDQVLQCKQCKSGELNEVVFYTPVYSFGDPKGKKIIVVANNPSTHEFEEGYLISEGTVERRLKNQLTYFEKPYYKLFFLKVESFFDGEVKAVLRWKKTCWEKVGFLDLTKCSTRTRKGQWSSLKPRHREMIIQNCERFLIKQLQLYKPDILLAYGLSSCKWFGNKYDVNYSNLSSSIIKTEYSDEVRLIKVYQKQGTQPHPPIEVEFIRRELARALSEFTVPG